MAQLRELNGTGLLKKMSLRSALALAFPAQKWDEIFKRRTNFAAKGGKRSMQRQLRMQLLNIFEGTPAHCSTAAI